jgi:hypothetical protein
MFLLVVVERWDAKRTNATNITRARNQTGLQQNTCRLNFVVSSED